MKRILAWVLAVFSFGMLLAMAACGEPGEPGGDGTRPAGTEIVIFMASDKVAGTNESAVKAAVEEKFWEDTGISIDLNIQIKNKSDFASTMTNAMASNSWDAAVSYLGIAGVDDNLIRNDAALDVTDLLLEYGQNILANTGDALNSLRSVEGIQYGITSVEQSKQYGILIRKDWMRQVGYTDDPSEVTDQVQLLNTIGQFTDMLRKFKEEIPSCEIPLAGAPWDLEYVLTSGVVEGQPSYATNVFLGEGDNVEVGPGYLHPNYGEVLSYAYQWSKMGLWEQYEAATTYSARERWFVSGTTGVYVGNPKVTELIRVARNLQATDPNAEVTIIGPLAAGGSDGVAILSDGKELRGFRAEDPAYSGLVINPRSDNAEIVVKYLNWVQASKENYELCAYGILGQDWEAIGDDQMKYPAGKEDLYLKSPSYSGAYKLVANIQISDRRLASYTETEQAWLDAAATAPCYESVTNGMFLFKPGKEIYSEFLNSQNRMMTQIIYKAWNGTQDPLLYHMEDETNGVAGFRNSSSAYLTWMTNQYLLASV